MTPASSRKCCRNKPFLTISKLPELLIPLAREHTKWKEALYPSLPKKLWWRLRRTQDPLLRKAFHLHIRQIERERDHRNQRQRDQLLKWASRRDLHTRRAFQAEHRMRVPENLDGENDCSRWGSMAGLSGKIFTHSLMMHFAALKSSTRNSWQQPVKLRPVLPWNATQVNLGISFTTSNQEMFWTGRNPQQSSQSFVLLDHQNLV